MEPIKSKLELLDKLTNYRTLVVDFGLLISNIYPIFDEIVNDEGFEKNIYRCPNGFYTIGYGINIDNRTEKTRQKGFKKYDVVDYSFINEKKLLKYFPNFYKNGEKVSKQEAKDAVITYCIEDILLKLPFLIKTDIIVPTKCIMALVSLLYNIGIPAFEKSRMLKAINDGDWETAEKECNWGDFVMKDGKLVKGFKGVMARRYFERALIAEGRKELI